VTVVPIKNREAIAELDRLREALLLGEATKFYAFTDVMVGDTFREAIFCGGEWEVTDLIAALGSLQSMELSSALEELFDLRAQVEGDDPDFVD